VSASARLLGELRLAGDGERGFSNRRACARLSAADRETVGARRDDAVADLVDVAEIAWVEGQMDVRGFAGAYVHEREAAKRPDWGARKLEEIQVQLD